MTAVLRLRKVARRVVLRSGEACLAVHPPTFSRGRFQKLLDRIAEGARAEGLEVTGEAVEVAFWESRNWLARRLGVGEVHPW